MSQTVLELEKLTIALPPDADRANAVSDVDLVLRAGKVTCLIGESGSGKSLVARSILGLLPRPHVRIGSGRILFEGQVLAVAPKDKMRAIRGAKIGMIFFFFQAEDGIRDGTVTGVQKCALPISQVGQRATCETACAAPLAMCGAEPR